MRSFFAHLVLCPYHQGEMSLVATTLKVRKTIRATYGLLVAAAIGGLVLIGVFSKPIEELHLEHLVVGLAWISVMATRLTHRSRLLKRDSGPGVVDLEIGALLIVASHAAVQIAGGLSSAIYPVVYVVIALLASFAARPFGSALVGIAVAFEASVHILAEGRLTDWEPLLLHTAFIVCFGMMSLLFTRAEIARVREHSKRELETDRARIKEESRMFRLVSAPSVDGVSDEERLVRSSIEEVRHQVYHVLQLLHRTLGLHTCVLLMREENDQLRIVELVTQTADIAEGPFDSGEGVVGAIIKRKMAMKLENLKSTYGGICYYDGGSPARSFLGVPILDGGVVRGVLCADRIDETPFTEREESALEASILHVLRALENERVFVQLERTKREQTVLHHASQKLGGALDEDAVLDAGLEAAEAIASFDFAAVTFYTPKTRKHRVSRAVGHAADTFSGLTFSDNTSLTAMAVKNRHYLPYRGTFDARQQVVFTKRMNLRGMKSLLILPLVVREDAIGTLILAARRHNAFGDAVRPTLQVLANQLAISLSNAHAVKRLEEMATTDGLTGCLNKRAFLDELSRRLRSAARFGRKLSLIVTDIDHFKSVNDTYGHATGDVVIKELGAILRRVKRETDVVARFGGEEFCVLCEETDTTGARLLAERIREELGKSVFHSELGKLSVTASLGVATFPDHAENEEDLFEASDKALYAAKHGGRDQVRAA